VAGFCKEANIKEIQSHNYALVPGRYVGFEKQYIEDFDINLIKSEIQEIEERMEQIVSKANKSLGILKKLSHGNTVS
jgi:type I restriction enzyme M protein